MKFLIDGTSRVEHGLRMVLEYIGQHVYLWDGRKPIYDVLDEFNPDAAIVNLGRKKSFYEALSSQLVYVGNVSVAANTFLCSLAEPRSEYSSEVLFLDADKKHEKTINHLYGVGLKVKAIGDTVLDCDCYLGNASDVTKVSYLASAGSLFNTYNEWDWNATYLGVAPFGMDGGAAKITYWDRVDEILSALDLKQLRKNAQEARHATVGVHDDPDSLPGG